MPNKTIDPGRLLEAVGSLWQAFPALAENQALRSTVFVQGTNQRAVDPRDRGSTKSRHNILNTAAKSAFKTAYSDIQTNEEAAHYLIPPLLNLHGPHSGFRSEAFSSRKQAGEFVGFNSETTFKEYFSEILLHLLRETIRANYAEQLAQAATLEKQGILYQTLQQHFKKISELLADTLADLWKIYCQEKADLKSGRLLPNQSRFISELKMLGSTFLGQRSLELHMAGFSRGGAICVFSANLLDWMFDDRCSTYLTLLDPATGPKKDKLLHHRLAPSIKKTSLFIAKSERLPIWQIGKKVQSSSHQPIESLHANCQHSDINVIRSNHKTRGNSKIMVALAIQSLEKSLPHVLEPNKMALPYIDKKGKQAHLNYSKEKILKRALSQTLPFEKRFFKKNRFFVGQENSLLRKTFYELYPEIYTNIRFIEKGQHLFSKEGWASTLAEALKTLQNHSKAPDQKSALVIREKVAHFFVDHLFKTQSLEEKKHFKTLEDSLKSFATSPATFSKPLTSLAKTYGKTLSLEGKDLELYLFHQKLFKNLRTFVHFRHEYATSLYAALQNPEQVLEQPLLTKALKQLKQARHLNISPQNLKAALAVRHQTPISQPSNQGGLFSASSRIFQEAARETNLPALPYV